MNDSLSRRTLAKGAAWAVPVVVTAASVPALATSTTTYGGTVCQLYYGKGDSTNYQEHRITLGISSSEPASSIPAGTTFTWVIVMSGGSYQEVPSNNYSANTRWALALSPAANGTTKVNSFTVNLVVNAQDVTAQELNCVPQLIWADTYSVSPETTITVTSTTSVPADGGISRSSSLSYTVAKRYAASVNASGRRSHKYLSKTGEQACYPAIQYLMTGASNISTCGDNGNDTSTRYPDGTCSKLQGSASTINTQQILVQKC